jgi:hypothetical protein
MACKTEGRLGAGATAPVPNCRERWHPRQDQGAIQHPIYTAPTRLQPARIEAGETMVDSRYVHGLLCDSVSWF